MRSGKIVRYNRTQQSAPQQAHHVLFSPEMLPTRLSRSSIAALLVCLAPIMTWIGTSAHAQTDAPETPETPIFFDIPAQALGSALTQYFSITGVQLLYDSALATGLRSSRVKGRLTRREALQRLLAGTGLIVRYSRADAAIITTPSGSQSPLVPLGRVVVRELAAPARMLSAERLAYYGQLEEDLHAQLLANERTSRLGFSLTVNLTIGADGTLVSVFLSRSSGNSKTDRLVTEALSQATVSPPPDDLQQPLAVVLRGIRGGEPHH